MESQRCGTYSPESRPCRIPKPRLGRAPVTPLQFCPGSLPLSRPVLTWVCGEPSNSSLTCDYVVKI